MQMQVEKQPKIQKRTPSAVRFPFLLHCPEGGKHRWRIAEFFLNEAEIFELQADPKEAICEKCLSRLRDVVEVKK